jgi:hypothetical protein
MVVPSLFSDGLVALDPVLILYSFGVFEIYCGSSLYFISFCTLWFSISGNFARDIGLTCFNSLSPLLIVFKKYDQKTIPPSSSPVATKEVIRMIISMHGSLSLSFIKCKRRTPDYSYECLFAVRKKIGPGTQNCLFGVLENGHRGLKGLVQASPQGGRKIYAR